MADIGTFTKLTSIWPARPSRPIEHFGLRKKPSQQRNKQQNSKQEPEQEGPGKNIDEYA